MLTGKQKRHLRALGHALKPVVLIGKRELDAAVIAEADQALASHELIKVKLLESCLLDRNEAAASMAEVTGSDVAQILGRTFLLYRRGEKPVLTLPQ